LNFREKTTKCDIVIYLGIGAFMMNKCHSNAACRINSVWIGKHLFVGLAYQGKDI
jgi:hypothetical protein